jgi:hypothetical protein
MIFSVGYESLFFTKSFKTQQSASCSSELPERHFYRQLARPAFVTCASRVVVTPVWIINVSKENAASGSRGDKSSQMLALTHKGTQSTFHKPREMIQIIAFLTCIKEEPGSKIVPNSKFSDKISLDLSQSLRAVIQNGPRPMSSTNSPIYI